MSFSFAYIGRNQANPEIFVSTVTNVENVIQKKWPLYNSRLMENELVFTLFENNCKKKNSDDDKFSEEFKQKLRDQARMRYEEEKIKVEMKK